jgi:hypothetical protein
MMMISRMPMLASLLRYPNDRCDKLVAKVIENRRVGYIASIRSVRAIRTAYQLTHSQATEKRPGLIGLAPPNDVWPYGRDNAWERIRPG